MAAVRSLLTCASYLTDADRGFDMYISDDGVNFETVTTNGFGDPYNHGLRVFAETSSGLTIGTANPFYGTQVWLMDEGGETEEYTVTFEDGVTGEILGTATVLRLKFSEVNSSPPHPNMKASRSSVGIMTVPP